MTQRCRTCPCGARALGGQRAPPGHAQQRCGHDDMHVERCENLKPYGFIDHGCMAGTYTTDLEAFDSYQVRLWNALVTASAKSALALVTAIWTSGCQSKMIACRH